MPLEGAGRSDKKGNEYERLCIVHELLKILQEMNYSVTIEALGPDETGTDILVKSIDGEVEHIQCKLRNASQDTWRFTDLKSKNILKNWKKQLKRGNTRCVTLMSPIACPFLVDLSDRAKNTNGEASDFKVYQIDNANKVFVDFYEKYCKEMGLDTAQQTDIQKSVEYLKRTNCKQVSEYTINEWIRLQIDFLFNEPFDMVRNALLAYVEEGNILGKEITVIRLFNFLESQKISLKHSNCSEPT